MADPWLMRGAHRHWLLAQGDGLLRHYARAKVDHGFGKLDDEGRLPHPDADTVTTARMVHSYALASLAGVPGAGPLADHGIAALLDGPLHDRTHGGWFTAEGAEGKATYAHAFVALAAATARLADRPRASALLDAAVDVIDTRLWIEDEGVVAPDAATDWSEREAYRGANANMHSVEAFLALADATHDMRWLERALRVIDRFAKIARDHDGLLPEHFTEDWQIRPDFHEDRPTDDLRPWGLTPGHSAEWATLLLRAEAGLRARNRNTRAALVADATRMFDAAMARGWAADGANGIVYTLGFDGAVSVPARPWWVHLEAANAACLLFRRTGEPRFAETYRTLWDYIAQHYVTDHGWRCEVDASGAPSGTVYPLRDDLYHAYQATLIPTLAMSASVAGGLRRGGLIASAR